MTCGFPGGFLTSSYYEVTIVQLFHGLFDCDILMKKYPKKCHVGPMAMRQYTYRHWRRWHQLLVIQAPSGLKWGEIKFLLIIIRSNKDEKSEFVPKKLLFHNKDRNLFMFAFIIGNTTNDHMYLHTKLSKLTKYCNHGNRGYFCWRKFHEDAFKTFHDIIPFSLIKVIQVLFSCGGNFQEKCNIVKKQDIFVKHRCPQRQQSQNIAKNPKVLHFDPAPSPGAYDVS